MEHWQIEAVGYAGTVFTAASYSMRTIIPLRIAGVLSSLVFIGYGMLIASWPILLTELIILPMNAWRLYQVLKLLKQVKQGGDAQASLKWLQPFARKRHYRAGDVLFRTGDTATYLLLVDSGRFRLKEAGIEIGEGDVTGEMGFLSPGNLRTMTLECVADGRVGEVSYFDLKQLYFSNPNFAFYLLQLISQRLFDNVERARREQAAA